MASGNERVIAQFKEIRSSAETHMSEKINKLTELMTACENIDPLKDVQGELKEVLQEFQIAHEAYHRLIKTESEQEKSTRYYNSVLEIVSELELEISSWINQPKSPPILKERSEQIEELKLQQRKAEIELTAEIAEAEPERKVYEEAEASEGVKSDQPRENYQFHLAAQESQQLKVASTPREGLMQTPTSQTRSKQDA